jgi:hypothetical protein
MPQRYPVDNKFRKWAELKTEFNTDGISTYRGHSFLCVSKMGEFIEIEK